MAHPGYEKESSGKQGAIIQWERTAQQAEDFIEDKFSKSDSVQGQKAVDKMLVELDGCEIRTAQVIHIKGETQTTPVYNNPKKAKKIKWRDVRLDFVGPLDSEFKIFAGKMGPYKSVVDQMYSPAVLAVANKSPKHIYIPMGKIHQFQNAVNHAIPDGN